MPSIFGLTIWLIALAYIASSSPVMLYIVLIFGGIGLLILAWNWLLFGSR